jgi:DNA-binding XRE family transcriptional regulator
MQTSYEAAPTPSTPLRVVRVAHGLSQAQLAERAHLARVTVGALERGENVPQLGTAQRLAEVLGVEIEDLFP